jgi:thiamine-monophosphate kinase
MTSENQLVEKIAKALGQDASGNLGIPVRLGLGDDAAIIDVGKGSSWVLSCDAFLEDVHFRADLHPADSVGYKALARATSDLAAMGASPKFYLLTLALPQKRTGKWLDSFLGGMRRASKDLGIQVVGGDTTSYPKITASITVLGEVKPGREVRRSGARPGDLIYVSGTLGRAELGWRLLQGGHGTKEKYRDLLQAHLYPRIRLELGAWLAEKGVASVMMDLSDGLSTDLARICAASKVGANLWVEKLPVVTGDLKLPTKVNFDPLQLALHGGEDYELLFCVSKRNLKRLQAAPGYSQLKAVGEVTKESGIHVVDVDGRAKKLVPGGWDPFRKA